jgi:pimeloyl-ACP methyl ester carboxylesterase
MKQLLYQHQSSDVNTKYNIYGIDYLGQGKSWPENCNDGMSEDEQNLGYSADLWIDQLTSFIQQVITPSTSQKVHIVGNSVGGYLGTILSYRHPELVETLTLLNATPVWGLNLPMWDGKLPAPPLPKFVGRALFDTIRNLDVIDKYLDVAYVYKQAYDGTFDDSFDDNQTISLNLKIRGCTEGKGGHAAFASILWSPPASTSDENGNIQAIGFYDVLKELPIDILLLFGSGKVDALMTMYRCIVVCFLLLVFG